jgi:hypothetical protein
MARTIIRDLFFGFVIFTLFLVGGVSMMGIFNDSNSEFTSDEKFVEFNRSMNKLGDVTTSVGSLEDKIGADPEEDRGVLGVLGTLIGGAWNALSFMGDAFKGLSTTFGVPLWITNLGALLILIITIFALYSALFQREI